jgi:NAD(P)-dependent dehydrogenase (short-subunit alcohol dehydrogenase family)
MRSKTIVITGASDGIGAAAARTLARHGHRLIVVGRSPEKTQAVAEQTGAEPLVADFARLDDVRTLADALLARCPHIDVLANNAGLVSGWARVVTGDGHELTNQVDYLAPFLLDYLLADRLADSHATVIATTSLAHWGGHIDLADLDHERAYQGFRAYADAKLALLVHTRELQRRFGRRGLVAVGFHPGIVATNFSAGSGTVVDTFYHSRARALLPSTPEQGADTLVYVAEATPGLDFPPGGYVVHRRPAAMRGCVRDPYLAGALWDRTRHVLGLH